MGTFRYASLTLLVGSVAALPAYRELIPNGWQVTKYPALGHANAAGSGPLNPFGKDFKAAGHEWTRDLCRKDSDSDGETNGQELGDPCCIWKEGGYPQRKWALGHPGLPDISTGLPLDEAVDCSVAGNEAEGAKDFQKYYYSNGNVAKGNALMLNEQSSFTSNEASLTGMLGWIISIPMTAIKHPSTLVDFFLPGLVYDDGELAEYTSWSLLPIHLRVSGLLMISNLAVIVSMGTLSVHTTFGWQKNLLFAISVWLYVDFYSIFLHMSLDNPYLNSWPLIGPEAARFQGHHDHPNSIVAEGWLKFIAPTFIMAGPGGLIWLCRKNDAVFRLFTWWGMVSAHLMMAAHRWSHQVPHRLPAMVQGAQHTGFLVTGEHHCLHHATYDVNFAIFSGIMDPMMNFLAYTIGDKSYLWVCMWAFWIVAPLVFFTIWERWGRNNWFPGLTATKQQLMLSARTLLQSQPCMSEGFFVGAMCNGACIRFAGVLGVVWVSATAVATWGFSLLSAHAAIMLSATILTMTEGYVSKASSSKRESDGKIGWLFPRETATENHAMSMRVTGGLMLVGSIAIAMHKFQFHEEVSLTALAPKSVHSLVGVSALVAIVVQVASGLLKKMNLVASGEKSLRWHGSLGKATYYLCNAAAILGIDSLAKRTSNYHSVYTVIVAAYLAGVVRGEFPDLVSAADTKKRKTSQEVGGIADLVGEHAVATPAV